MDSRRKPGHDGGERGDGGAPMTAAVDTAATASRQRSHPLGWLVVAVPYAWLVVLFLVPFAIVVKISLSTTAIAQPPYTPVIDIFGGIGAITAAVKQFTTDNYVFLTEDALYWKSYLSSLQIALISTFLILLVGYPIAYGMARAKREWRPTLLMLVILPFWTSFLIRVYAWIAILKPEGLLNQFLLATGVIDQPLIILNTNWAIYIGIVYSYLPFMVLPIYSPLEKMDHTLTEAALDLGCTPFTAFWRVTFPLSLAGVVAGAGTTVVLAVIVACYLIGAAFGSVIMPRSA